MEEEKATCPHCGNPNCREGEKFCSNCGKLLWNKCTDEGCPFSYHEDAVLAPDAVYCSACGSPSLFFKEGYITTKDFS